MAAMAVSREEKDPNRDPFPKGQVSRPGPSSLHSLPPPTLPRAQVFTPCSSLHPSAVVIGWPSVAGSLGCQIGVLLLGTNDKVALWVCWTQFSTLGLFPASSTRLPLEWKGALVAELIRGDPLKASQSFGVQTRHFPESYFLALYQTFLAGAPGCLSATLLSPAQLGLPAWG